jgi:hypothetical protein
MFILDYSVALVNHLHVAEHTMFVLLGTRYRRVSQTFWAMLLRSGFYWN